MVALIFRILYNYIAAVSGIGRPLRLAGWGIDLVKAFGGSKPPSRTIFKINTSNKI
jgi:hypothetical protein